METNDSYDVNNITSKDLQNAMSVKPSMKSRVKK